MKNQTVIITGASTGIGRAIAHFFVAKGSNVVINSANERNLETAYQSFDNQESVVAISGDVANPEIGKKLVTAAMDHFGSVDVLINNAGVFQPKPFLDVVDEDLDRYLSINLKGTFYTSQAVIPQMLRQKGGAIINIGTVLVDHAIAGFPATAPITSKGAIHALTRQLAAEFGKDNIRGKYHCARNYSKSITIKNRCGRCRQPSRSSSLKPYWRA